MTCPGTGDSGDRDVDRLERVQIPWRLHVKRGDGREEPILERLSWEGTDSGTRGTASSTRNHT
jgi:hypothetical protein